MDKSARTFNAFDSLAKRTLHSHSVRQIMKIFFIIYITTVCFLAISVQGEDLKTIIHNKSSDHPRLFITNKDDKILRKKIKTDPTLKKVFDQIKTFSDALDKKEPIKREKTGKRLLSISRTCLKRVTYLAFVYRITKEKRYAIRAQKEMLAAASFTDWNPSHFLDVGEMTAGLAIGYDWLYETLTPQAQETIKTAIIEKGLKPSLKGGSWVTTENNWNQVCHGGLTLGALAVMDDEPDLASQIIERAIKNIPRAMAGYAPDGAYPEGPGYWKYGTTYNVLLIAALESSLGTDFGLTNAEGFMKSSDYYLQTTGPTGLFFNYSDCGSRGGISPAMYWFASKRNKPSLLYNEQKNMDLFLSKDHSSDNSSTRFLPFVIIWANPVKSITLPKINNWKANGKTPIAIHRSGWNTSKELFVGIKGGSPGTNHAHMDIGSFVMDANGIRWAEDLGSQSYYSLESKGVDLWNKRQNSQRWDVFRLNNFSHNTLVVDGQKQLTSGYAPIIAFSEKPPMPHTIIDMSSVYKHQLLSANRGIAILNNQSVLVQDEIKTLDHETMVRWGMVTRADIQITGRRTAILRQGSQQMSLQILNKLDTKLEIFETAKPPAKYDAPNKGTQMIGFTVKIPPTSTTQLIVWLRPDRAVNDTPKCEKLSNW